MRCDNIIEHSPVFEAPCGHDDCPSAVFHGICLMEWRDHRVSFVERIRKQLQQAMEAHIIVIPVEPPDA
jgi:hypothetical protein